MNEKRSLTVYLTDDFSAEDIDRMQGDLDERKAHTVTATRSIERDYLEFEFAAQVGGVLRVGAP